jgi:predicted transcriptional regulator
MLTYAHKGTQMKNRRRDKTEIIALILRLVNNNTNRSGMTQRRIMYGAHLSFVQLKGYLSLMLEIGFVEFEKGERVYRTTEKGKHFLQIYNEIGSKMSSQLYCKYISTFRNNYGHIYNILDIVI